ncbi:MAG: hypothetical protein KKH83_06695, partial [Candidatus Margulisbacteria bacterium]|nr:hypothetical protein [Candidatus Margulisiibacteriota bacterium]
MKIFGGKPSAGINTPGIRRKESKLSLIIAFVAALGLPIGGIALFSLLGNNKNISTPLVSSQRPLDYVETKPDIPYIHERLLPELVLDREEFVQEVLRDLHKDLNSVPLSRFILRSSFIDKNIE